MKFHYCFLHKIKSNGKGHPRTDLEVLEGVKVQVKFILEEATKTLRGSRGVALISLYPRRKMGWVVNATPRPLYPREREPVPIV
jgi:hypothetical protein